ncbi:MAG: YHS domain-containing protein [Candidatus Omnitrophota bacterium]|nr:YHS domain-containing protein [Candidatus Omnitrophota bacterium]
MSKRILMILAVISLVLGINKLSFAMSCGDHSGDQQLAQAHSGHEHGTAEAVKEAGSPAEAINAGNKICPVSGEKIAEDLKTTYEYEGKIYNFCCPACIEEFKKDPEKYIKKVEEELKA